MTELTQSFHRSRRRLWHNALAAALAWTAFMAASLGWSFFEQRREILGNARHEAQLSFQKELMFRFWTDGHGGSAPATNNVPPGVDLARIDKRTLLTLLAPMLRQIEGRIPKPTGYRSRLASLKPLRPENTPDAWEAGALQAFAKGETEVAAVVTLDGQEYMRVMRPLVNEASCLSCHGAQNYKVGDIRGGLSVSMPLAPLKATAQNESAVLVIVDGIIWVLGLGVIGFVTRRMQARNWERAMASEALRESAEHLEEAQRLARIGSWHWTVATDTVKWSETLYNITGRDPKLAAPSFAELPSCYSPESWNRLSAAVTKALHTGESYALALEIVRPDGTTRHTFAHGKADYDAGGRIVGLHGAVQDITERKLAEAARQASEEQYRSLFEHMAEGVAYCQMLFDGDRPQDFVYLAVNRAFETQTGLKNVTGRKVSEIIPGIRESDPGLFEVYGRVARGGAPERFENYVEPLKMWFEISVYSPGHDQFVAVFDVITERKQGEEKVRLLNAELEQRVRDRTAELEAANKELEAFSYSVSHDLRAPLRAMDGFSMALLEDYAGKLDETAQHHLRRIRANSQHMAVLIDDLLNLSQLTRAEMQRQRVDLTAMAEAVGAELQRMNPERVVELVVAPALAAEVDPRMVRVVMNNLLGNAWKFTSQRAPARIEVGVREQDGEHVFFVRDNGAGFDMAYAGKLFGAFQRLHSAQEFEGNGIGLALVQRIVHRHGGRVWAEGAVGLGATFHFTFGKERD